MHNVAQAECCFEKRSEFVIFVTPGDARASHETFNDINSTIQIVNVGRQNLAQISFLNCQF